MTHPEDQSAEEQLAEIMSADEGGTGTDGAGGTGSNADAGDGTARTSEELFRGLIPRRRGH